MSSLQENEPTWPGWGELWNEHDLARHWKKSVRTLQRWRADGSGPAFIRIGGSVRYRIADVRAFEDRRRESERGDA